MYNIIVYLFWDAVRKFSDDNQWFLQVAHILVMQVQYTYTYTLNIFIGTGNVCTRVIILYIVMIYVSIIINAYGYR